MQTPTEETPVKAHGINGTAGFGVAAIFLLIAILGCGGGERSDEAEGGSLSGRVEVDGSSTVFPITEAVAEEFQGAFPDARVTVGISGTGGGFKKFCNGETDISNASRPIKTSEEELCAASGVRWIELPIAYDGIAVVVHPSNDWAGTITVAELKKLWEPEAQRTVMRWNQVRAGWPDREIRLFAPGVDSGTFDYFTEAIVGEEGASRGDFTASEDANVLVQGIATDPLALGFFGYAYYEENQERLKLLAVDGSDGSLGVAPSPETIRDGTYQPLSRPVFIYIREGSLEKPIVSEFVKFYIDNAVTLVREVGYIPLPERAYELAQQRVDRRVTGSIFGGGSQVGVSIEELLAAGQPQTE
jgi:phosphate transport system substrate-binding protein